MRHAKQFIGFLSVLLLTGCHFVVLSPSGDIAQQQTDLLIQSTVLMLLIIIPVMAATAWFAWHYRSSNQKAKYEPEWDHSIHLELLIWSSPLLIIICLGALTWVGTHLLDPYRDLDRLSEKQEVPTDAKPLEIEVVALDWKWLFLYPQYGIATVNELAAPVDRPIDFHITSSTVMNSFFIPALAGQIYAMPAMETRLHAVINHPGDYKGFSANYSGAGFSGMHFVFHGLSSVGFDEWIANVKKADASLTREGYRDLEKPSENVPVIYYSSVKPGLFAAILDMCVDADTPCSGMKMGQGIPENNSSSLGETSSKANGKEMDMSMPMPEEHP